MAAQTQAIHSASPVTILPFNSALKGDLKTQLQLKRILTPGFTIIQEMGFLDFFCTNVGTSP
jgi:hypothetical protein